MNSFLFGFLQMIFVLINFAVEALIIALISSIDFDFIFSCDFLHFQISDLNPNKKINRVERTDF